MELLQLAFGNLLRARARFVMTAGGVLVGTVAVILLIALTIGLQNAAEAGIGSSTALTELDVWPSWNPNVPSDQAPQLTIETVRSLWKVPDVVLVIPSANLDGGGEMTAGQYTGYSGGVG
ncbi:MAG: hypothetical protein B6D42_16270, partial [Anaerolineae bacterium UTCFX5]